MNPYRGEKMRRITFLAVSLVMMLFLQPKAMAEFSHDISVNLSIGDHILFGQYEQDNKQLNGKEPIEWLVLDKQGTRALLISKYGLDGKKFNEGNEKVKWEDCTLRSWLNTVFFNEAFSEKEQEKILTIEVDNSASQGYWDVGDGCNTQDKIFLLSCAEVQKYFGAECSEKSSGQKNTEPRTAATPYANTKWCGSTMYGSTCLTVDGKVAVSWWLRSPGIWGLSATAMAETGEFVRIGSNYLKFLVRPAMWISLD